MLKTGIMLANRYECVGKIGSGGMADVYKCRDHKLNRFVAVKVMKPEFQGDSTFVSKFRREAQAAAGLANPNIVNVYDVGEDQGSYYIVMELVEGITLKEYIEKKGKLSVREATSIAIQVCMGLAAAHDQGIVHRDVKPQNIIISTDGKVKVTDFGIARAASSNTISANAMGSVHYSSPEQVRGGYSDSRSDIYSLGITLYEMVTGRVPFDGETTVAIAIKHLQDEMEAPSKYASDLPISLEQIIYKCTQKSVDRRYQTMNEVITDLKRSLMEPDGNFVQLTSAADNSQTTVITKDDQKAIRSAGKVNAPTQKKTFSSIEAAKRGKEQDEEDDADDDFDEDDDEEGSSVLEKAVTIGSFIVCALIICVLIYFIAKAAGLVGGAKKNASAESTVVSSAAVTADETDSSGEEVVATVTVPNLLGMTEAEAQKAAEDKSLTLKFGGEETSNQAEGTVISQDPENGTQVPKNSTITYVKSSGPAMAEVPSVDGLYIDEAKQAVKAAGFTNVQITKENSSDVELGYAVSVSPAVGEKVTVDTTVTITISLGSSEDTAYLYDYVGTDGDDALYYARQDGFIVTAEYVDDADAGENEVISQTPSGEQTTDYGTEVILTINNAEKAAAQSEAEQAAEAAAEAAATAVSAAADTDSTAEAAVQPTVAASTSGWKTAASLLKPSNYGNGPYRLTLVQNVNGQDQETVITESNTALSFPYTITCDGAAGVADGTIYLYEKTGDNEYTPISKWPVTFTEEQ